MTRSLCTIFLLWLVACSHSSTSTSQTCSINKAADVPVHLVGGALLVTAALDQQPVQMIVDTGVFSTTVTPEIVHLLGLPTDPHISTRLLGIGDGTARSNTDVHSFAVGDQVWSDRSLVTSPLERTFDLSPPVAGRIGTDYLAHFDVELDLPHQRLKLWQVQGCSGDFAFANRPHWPMKLERNGASLMVAAASLDGQPISAGIAWGAAATVLTETAAARIGVMPTMLQADRLEHRHETGGNEVDTHVHRFAEFRIGPDVFRSVPIAVAPIPTHVDMLLGLDYAHTRDIWLSYSTRQLFVALPAAPQPQANR